MSIGPRLEQRLVMTPMLQLAIRLLQLSTIELQELLQQELTENPLLEEADPEEAPTPETTAEALLGEGPPGEAAPAEPAPDVPELPFELADVMFGPPEERSLVQQEDHEETRYENFVGAPVTLADRLAEQLRLSPADPDVRQMAEYVIGNVDEDGYVSPTLMFERALDLVQSFDPAGVGARDVQECFRIQARRMPLGERVAARLVDDQFQSLLRWHEVAHTPDGDTGGADRVATEMAWAREWFGEKDDKERKERFRASLLSAIGGERAGSLPSQIVRRHLDKLLDHIREERERTSGGPGVDPGAGKDRLSEIARSAEETLERVRDAVAEIRGHWEQRVRQTLSEIARFARAPGRGFPDGEALRERLREQLQASLPWADVELAAQAIIGHINAEGYLEVPLGTLGEKTALPVAERAMALVQSFDPPGIGARTLQECLLIQLSAQTRADPVAVDILRDHFESFQRRRYSDIARTLRVPEERVREAIGEIAGLEPKPGRPFSGTETRYVVPDVYVRKVDDDYVVILNEDGIPRLRINNYYRSVIGREQGDDARRYVEDRLRSAVWLIKSIQQRQKTLYKVTYSIVQFQKAFLDKGLPYLRPLSLRHVAEDIQMHESTVSRVTTSKYVETPQGVLPLKYFFHSGIAKAEGDDVSSVSVKKMIADLVTVEDSRKPLSDQDVTKLLTGQGLTIARRTVAKYREELGILPSHQRRLAIRKRP